MDATIYSLVLTPELRELLGNRGTPENIGWYDGIILGIFLERGSSGSCRRSPTAERLAHELVHSVDHYRRRAK